MFIFVSILLAILVIFTLCIILDSITTKNDLKKLTELNTSEDFFEYRNYIIEVDNFYYVYKKFDYFYRHSGSLYHPKTLVICDDIKQCVKAIDSFHEKEELEKIEKDKKIQEAKEYLEKMNV